MQRRLPTWALVVGVALAGGCSSGLDESSTEAWSPVWSPDGDSLAYVSVRTTWNLPPSFESSVRVVDLERERDRVLLEGTGWHPDVAWSPDGRWLAVPSDRDRRRGRSCFQPPCEVLPEIYLVKRDGSAMRRLTNNHAADFAPAWSPDGRRLAFISGRDRPKNARTWRDVYVKDLARGGLVRITRNDSDEAGLVWSRPDRLKVEQFDGSCVWISLAERRTAGPCAMRTASERVVAPRSRAVAWLSRKDRNGETCFVDSGEETCSANAEVYIRSGNGRQLRITRTKADEHELAWSPDGRRLAFTTDGHVWIVNADGTGLRRVSGR